MILANFNINRGPKKEPLLTSFWHPEFTINSDTKRDPLNLEILGNGCDGFILKTTIFGVPVREPCIVVFDVSITLLLENTPRRLRFGGPPATPILNNNSKKSRFERTLKMTPFGHHFGPRISTQN